MAELFLRRRKDPNIANQRASRKLSNFGLILISSVLSTMFVRIAPIAASEFSANIGFGLLHQVNLPSYLETICAVIALDLVIYFQHRAFHYFSFLWRFHRIHHVDNLLDVTTALRFHPLEILLSLLIKSVFVIILGVSVEAVFIFEIILSSMAIFNHANIQLPLFVEKVLRYVVVTPNFHVIHHHPKRSLHDSNFGFNLSVWDYIFGSYVNVDSDNFSNFSCGLESGKDNSLKRMLLTPFKRQ